MRAIDRFMAKVKRGHSCWHWVGAVHGRRQKRGCFWDGQRTVDACRWIYQHENPNVDIRGRVIRHKCDYALCVNPAHLEPGTQADNVADMWARGRADEDAIKRGAAKGRATMKANPALKARGERHGMAALSQEKVAEIRSSTDRTKVLAAKFGVNRTTIQRARSGKHWK